MKNKSQKWAFSLGVGLTSVIALATPSQGSILYEVEFFDNEGNPTGSGVFSHEEQPFEGTLPTCTVFAPENYCAPDYEITLSDNYFKVDRFSVKTYDGPFSTWSLGENVVSTLFWRPFDEIKLASHHTSGRFNYFLDRTSWFAGYNTYGGAALDIGLIMSPDGTWDIQPPTFIPGFLEEGGTWTATRRTSVPEPASIFGLMALGALGTGSVLKRNRH